MAGLQVGDFDSPDETRSPDKTTVDLVRMGDAATAARLTLQPGWRWSECIKPVVGTDSCQVRHVGFLQSGQMHVTHDDGSEDEIGPGKAYVIEPGHDAWVVGDRAGRRLRVRVEVSGGVRARLTGRVQRRRCRALVQACSALRGFSGGCRCCQQPIRRRSAALWLLRVSR